MKLKSKVLIIAGSDSSGGAGIQADIKTVTSLGSYAMTAITAVTAQNTKSVKAIISISPKNVQKQITMILDDIGTNAIKIGMLHNTKIIKCVCNILKKYKLKNVVLDPVMIAKGGAQLINSNSITYLKKNLLPLCSVITPNIPEAEILTGHSILSKEDMIKAAKEIISMGAKNVLLKGGHLKNKMIFDILVSRNVIKVFPKRKIKTKNTHGTGCTLSSALATFLSQKKNIYKSCKFSLKYVDQAIYSAPGFGNGYGPLNHLVSFNLKNNNA
ncbi:MAG: bifunctional hydroxymethylpyrimidine kinase/phosphomethylpyrimidine kinase [Candidatus Pelagibacterales bacterium]|nr:MAG: bifunctional hydroxymethylpyrimidine kinase/phosphomethylpyrimidine kinase [Pelagibacterales bacterium]